MVFMGVYPRPFLEASQKTVSAIQERVTQRQAGGMIEKVEIQK
jgi:NADH:ubiquinone oxidoreductase subunit 4 (subunit M)